MDESQNTHDNRIERFIKTHNRIEDYLIDVVDKKHSNKGFRDLLDIAESKENVLIRIYKDDLIRYNRIRNIISHERKTIADLHKDYVKNFEEIADNICSQERLIPKFESEIKVFDTDNRLVSVLEHMKENDYSQVVIDRGGLLSLLTVEGISKWLEVEAGQKAIDVTTADVSDALVHEIEDSFICMGSAKTVHAARNAFAKAPEENGSRLFAVIITNTGSRVESPLGIVTSWDLVHLDL